MHKDELQLHLYYRGLTLKALTELLNIDYQVFYKALNQDALSDTLKRDINELILKTPYKTSPKLLAYLDEQGITPNEARAILKLNYEYWVYLLSGALDPKVEDEVIQALIHDRPFIFPKRAKRNKEVRAVMKELGLTREQSIDKLAKEGKPRSYLKGFLTLERSEKAKKEVIELLKKDT